MFVDASAVVAIITGEAERREMIAKIEDADDISVSAITVYEATLAVARIGNNVVDDAKALVDDFIAASEAQFVPIDSRISGAAIEAFAKFGKGRHKAGLNMGDCFAYACAKSLDVPLLCKGNDFGETDIKLA